jgi:hypothetical protein
MFRRFAAWWRGDDARQLAAEAFRQEIYDRFPFTPLAKDWLRANVGFEVRDPAITHGGGYWWPEHRKVELFTVQYEAAIHELAHAWWHDRRHALKDGLVAVVIRLADERDPRYARAAELAGHYVRGIPSQSGFEQGMLLAEPEWGTGGGPRGEWNDWEMFAGLASGVMADIRRLPPYLQSFYEELFFLLPEDAPSPMEGAPHG